MTMTFATYTDAIKAWVLAQSTIAFVAQGQNEAGGWQQKPRIRIRIRRSSAIGTDYLSYDEDTSLPDGADYVPTVHGNRQLVVTLFCTTRDQHGNGIAAWYLEKLRTSLRKPSVHDALYTAGLAYATYEEVVDLDTVVDDRVESQASWDIRFNAVSNERDTKEADSFVETIQLQATLTKPDGVDIVRTIELG